MQAAYEDTSCNTRVSEMSELNVMDFVETEYKSDNSDNTALRNKVRRKSQRVSKVPLQYQNDFCTGRKSSYLPKGFKKQLKRRRSLDRSKMVTDDDNKGMKLYPYCTLMKVFSGKVNIMNNEEVPRAGKLFKQLSSANLCYPYATFLQELHNIALEDDTNAFTKHDDESVELARGQISEEMKSFNFKTSSLIKNFHSSDNAGKGDFETTFTTILLDMVKNYNLNDQSNVSCESIRGVGKILRLCMMAPPLDIPSRELQSSALLQKLSHLVEKEKSNCNRVKNDLGYTDVCEDLLSESSHDEEGVEWKPSASVQPNAPSRLSQNVQEKRKSSRRKKITAKFDASPNCKLPRTSNKFHRKSKNNSQSLLQLILAKESSSHKTKKVRNRSYNNSTMRIEVLEKIKDKIYNRKVLFNSCDENSSLKTPEYPNPEETVYRASEKQNITDITSDVSLEKRSLLKEYLLKSTGENTTIKDNCNSTSIMPSSFSFSKLLQDFKSASDSRYSKGSTTFENLSEDAGSSILRRMLIESCKPLCSNSSSDDEVKDFKPMELLDVSSLQSLLSEKNGDDVGSLCDIKQEVESEDEESSSDLLRELLLKPHFATERNGESEDGGEDTMDTSLTNDLKVSVADTSCSLEAKSLDLTPICKIKCEVTCEEEFLEEACEGESLDETHECKICHLAFSSRIDLANHEVLFHSGESIKAQSPGSSYILPHSTDILQTGLFQEKLPA